MKKQLRLATIVFSLFLVSFTSYYYSIDDVVTRDAQRQCQSIVPVF